jgi:hypothetical protein
LPSPGILIGNGYQRTTDIFWLLAVGPDVVNTLEVVTLHPASLCPVGFDLGEDTVKGVKIEDCLLLLTACQNL